jgi:hypothetical protein
MPTVGPNSSSGTYSPAMAEVWRRKSGLGTALPGAGEVPSTTLAPDRVSHQKNGGYNDQIVFGYQNSPLYQSTWGDEQWSLWSNTRVARNDTDMCTDVLNDYTRRIQPVAATSSLNRSAGVSHERVLRGRSLSRAAMASRSAWE